MLAKAPAPMAARRSRDNGPARRAMTTKVATFRRNGAPEIKRLIAVGGGAVSDRRDATTNSVK